MQSPSESEPGARPLSPALAASNRDLAGLLLLYADKRAWREGRDTEVIERALRRVRIVWWTLGTVYAAMTTNAALGLLASEPEPERRMGMLVVFLVLAAVTAMLLRRGSKASGALEAELRHLGSPVPAQKPFVAAAAIAYSILVLLDR